MRIYLGSLGCKLNQSEMDALALQLAEAGHEVLPSPEGADLCILNTCAVTQTAAQKSRQALGRLHRQSPAARLVATGCYAELSPTQLYDLPGVELVAGNRDKEGLAEWVLSRQAGSALPAEGRPGTEGSLERPGRRTRALVKIQDGCDNACTYCVVRVARGSQRSRPATQILDEVRARLAAGYQEIVLTGVHIGAYGRDRGALDPCLDLWGLVRQLLAETAVPRLRLSSIEPWDLAEPALSLWQDPRLCRHLHLPLQSGCDATLGRMARRYAAAQFAVLAAAARGAISDLALTTDLIVGFPGETEAEFAQSLEFVRAMEFARVHVFPYSARPGTPAAQMPDQIPPPVKAERAGRARAAASAGAGAFRRAFVGKTLSVLWESSRRTDSGRVWGGLTDNYLRVYTACSENLANVQTATRLTAVVGEGLWGEIGAQKSEGW